MVKISCDRCDKDISNTSGIDSYRYQLIEELIPSSTNISLLVYVKPSLDGSMVFCSLNCVKDYLQERLK